MSAGPGSPGSDCALDQSGRRHRRPTTPPLSLSVLLSGRNRRRPVVITRRRHQRPRFILFGLLPCFVLSRSWRAGSSTWSSETKSDSGSEEEKKATTIKVLVKCHANNAPAQIFFRFGNWNNCAVVRALSARNWANSRSPSDSRWESRSRTRLKTHESAFLMRISDDAQVVPVGPFSARFRQKKLRKEKGGSASF